MSAGLPFQARWGSRRSPNQGRTMSAGRLLMQWIKGFAAKGPQETRGDHHRFVQLTDWAKQGRMVGAHA